MFPQALFPLFVALSCNLIAQAAKNDLLLFKNPENGICTGSLPVVGFPAPIPVRSPVYRWLSECRKDLILRFFAVTAVFAFIVMYDACHVRYYSGKKYRINTTIDQGSKRHGSTAG